MEDVWFGSDLTHHDVEPVLRALSLHGHRTPPLIAVSNGGAKLVLASRIFFRFFGVSDGDALAARLLTGRDPGARRLAVLCHNLAINGAPRLERLRFFVGPATEVITFLCRRVLADDQQPLFVAAALGLSSDVEISPDRSVAAAPPGLAMTMRPITDSVAVPRTTDLAAEMSMAEALSANALRPEAMTFQAIQATLRTRWPTNRSIRFLWQTDSDLVCTQVSPPLAEVVGAANAALVGLSLPDLALKLDPGGRLGEALASKTTWSGIEVPWPIGEASAAVEVGLGAIAVFDRERGFDGFRGYGVIRLDRILAHRMTQLIEPLSDKRSLPSDNVVTFPSGSKALSVEDEAAFNALGAELRVEIGGDPTYEPVLPAEHPHAGRSSETSSEFVSDRPGVIPATTPAAGLPTPSSVDRAADVGRNSLAILDRVAVGLLVSRDNVPIFANRHLLDLTGFADEDALRAAGGMAHLFGDMPGNASGAEAVAIRTQGGGIIPMIARMQRIDWDSLPATLLTLLASTESAAPRASILTDPIVKTGAEALPASETKDLVAASPSDTEESDELRAILETVTDGVAVMDSACNVLSLNRSGEALFGCNRDEVVGKPFLSLFAPHNQGLADEYFKGLQSSATKSLLNDGREILIKAHQGGTIPVFMTLGRLDCLGSGELAGASRFCALFRDLTPWKKVEQELESARANAERASALKSEFLTKVSHEIRTPLNSIIGFAETMRDERFGPIGNERYKEYARDIHASGTHVASLVDDLLDLSKIEAGKMELVLDPLDVNTVVSATVALMQPQANRERVIMRLSLAPNLPQVRADERSLSGRSCSTSCRIRSSSTSRVGR